MCRATECSHSRPGRANPLPLILACTPYSLSQVGAPGTRVGPEALHRPGHSPSVSQTVPGSPLGYPPPSTKMSRFAKLGANKV